MRVEEIFRIERAPSDLGVEVEAAVLKTALLQQDHRSPGCHSQIRRELVGVPAQHRITLVDVETSQLSRRRSGSELALHRMTGEPSVIGLNVQHEVVPKIELTQKVQRRRRVEIILVGGGLHRLRFDQEHALKANFLSVINCQVKEASHQLSLALIVGI